MGRVTENFPSRKRGHEGMSSIEWNYLQEQTIQNWHWFVMAQSREHLSGSITNGVTRRSPNQTLRTRAHVSTNERGKCESSRALTISFLHQLNFETSFESY